MANKLAKGEKLEDREIVEYANQRMLEFESLPEVNAEKIKLPISADRCPNCKYFTRGIQTINHD